MDSVARLRTRVVVLSAFALFLELALIRYVASEVRIFAYFKNLILIACFLGFGLGFFHARSRTRLAGSLAFASGIVLAVNIGLRADLALGPHAASIAFSNFAGSLTMGEDWLAVNIAPSVLLAGTGWTLVLFLSCMAAMYGYAQHIGADIESFGLERRIEAYSWNVLGSLLGILAFAVVSRAAWGPIAWFVPVVLATVPFLGSRATQAAACLTSLVLVWALWPDRNVVWSAYQKLEWKPKLAKVDVNGTGYMSLRSFEGGLQLDRFHLPHLLRPEAQSVLIVAAGGGNDASVALRAGAKRVVAVDIDPEIVRLGRRHHPDRPYSDERVEVVIEDARRYGETSTERFDLIVFSHLDSHTALSGFTNVRLDNYIYTVESFRTFRRLLAPGGALYVSFWATRPWVATRLSENLSLAFGKPPVALHWFDRQGERVVNLAHYFESDDPTVHERAMSIARTAAPPWDPPPPPAPSTDDWPYLFVETRHVPLPQLLLAFLLGCVVTAAIGILVGREMKRGGGWPLDRHYFFLGAGFLLVETHNVGRLARVFGTTWSVNAWVISGVLTVILAANYVASRRPAWAGGRIAYALLFANLAAGAFVPINAILALPLGSLAAILLYTLPLFFAGLIFAGSFRAAEHPMRALGSNVLGSLLGGFLELASFTTGISGLLLVAAGLYALSYRAPPVAVPSSAGS